MRSSRGPVRHPSLSNPGAVDYMQRDMDKLRILNGNVADEKRETMDVDPGLEADLEAGM